MRDSLGMVAPLRVIAFDLEGNPVPGVTPTFIVRDTGSHVVGALLIGDHTITTSVLGAIAGLQTDTAQIPVTLPPQQITATDSVRHLLTPSVSDLEVTSTDLRTRVVNGQGTTATGIQAVIVRYEIVQAPPPTGTATGPTVILRSESAPSGRDTTNETGLAGRRLRFRLLDIATATTDSAVINATASYRGQSLGTVQFTVVFTKQ
jgi:hypothetical protein